MNKNLKILALGLCVSGWVSAQDRAALLQPEVDARYNGGYPTEFPAAQSAATTLLRTTPVDVATQLGIPYQGGFQHPLKVRYADGAPALSLNPFFYLDASDETKPFSQKLIVNVEGLARQSAGAKRDDLLRRAFQYTMALALINDWAGEASHDAVPLWLAEGSAVYISGFGEALVEEAAKEVPRSRAAQLADDLNRPLPITTRRQYAVYYLAVKFIVEKFGAGSFQTLMREVVVNGKPVTDVILNNFQTDWGVFQRDVKQFTTDAFAAHALPDDTEPVPTHRK